MKRYLLIAAILVLANAAYGRGVEATETIPLRYLDAASVPTTVHLPRGLDQLTLNLNDNSITVRGDQEAITTFKAALRAKDVPITDYLINVRLVRYKVDAHGHVTETVVMTPSISTLDSIPATLSVSSDEDGYALLVTPSKGDGKTVTLTVEVRELGEQGEIVHSGKNERRVALGEKVHITGMTDAADKTLHRAVMQGEVVTNRGAYTGYYVEVQPAIRQH